MKDLKASLIRLGLLLVMMTVLVGMTMANTTEPTLNARIAAEAKNVIVKMNGLNIQGATLTIQDVTGVRLYNERIDQEGDFAKKYNLKNLPNGEYSMIIEDAAMVWTQNFVIADDQVITTEMQQWVKPNFTFHANKLGLELPQAAANGYSLNIYNQQGDKIFSEEKSISSPGTRVYNLTQLVNGNYTAILSQNGENYTYNVVLK